jgi:hypothetical protein
MVEKLAVEVALKVTGVDEAAKSFDQATRSIAALGSTGKEALEGAAAAAAKFGASANELARVEGLIKALNARADDSSTAFSVLAANYDKATAGARAHKAAAQQVGEAVANVTNKVASLRPQLTALSASMAAMGVPFGGLVSALSRVGLGFGVFAGGTVAIVGTATALIKFASAAEETEKALTQLQKVSGQSFEKLSALSIVFARGGTPLKQFASEFGNLSEKIASAGEQAAKQNAISQRLEDIDKGLKVAELPAITLNERVTALLETLSTVPPTQQWFALADIFKKLGDTGQELERARIGKALGLSPETITTLSQGSEALKQLQADAERLGLTLTSSNQKALQEMSQGWNQFTGLLSAFFDKIGALAAPAFSAILSSFQPVMQQIVADFQNLPLDQAISNLGTRLGPAFEALGQVLVPIITALGTAAGTAFANAVLAAITSGLTPDTSLWDAILADFTKFGESIVANARILAERIKQALGLGGGDATPASGGGGGAPTKAAGGLLGGRGTGTSDSNLAWVSRGEYITPARAVAQPGVLAFLEALRRSGGNLRGVLDGMGRFALGGMVPRAMPAFAGGGSVGSMSNVTIQFPGLPAINGLRASSAVVGELHRAAALAQVRSGGRKPSRYS